MLYTLLLNWLSQKDRWQSYLSVDVSDADYWDGRVSGHAPLGVVMRLIKGNCPHLQLFDVEHLHK